MKLVFLLLLTLQGFSALAADNYDRPAIEAWLNSDVPRGRGFVVANAFPTAFSMKYCAGAGCPIKIPFTFTEAQIRHFAEVMNDATRNARCSDASACERLGLQYAVREMDRTVRSQRLQGLNLDEATKLSVYRDNHDGDGFMNRLGNGQWFLRDCVDQAANGSSFLVILANQGLLKHHRVVAPGQTNFLWQPHFFTQIREIEGNQLYQFDLYREPRTDFDKLALVQRH